MTIVALFGILVLLLCIGFPILLATGLVGLGGILAVPNVAPALFPQKMFAILDSYSLLALPYYILAGELMSRGGISRRLVEFAESAVGHVRGGVAHSAAVSSMIFAGISGSSTADTSAIGSILIPAMKSRGYKPGFAASVVATAGTIGAIIPPSTTMIMYGSLTGVSVGAMFLGGIIPGMLMGLFLMGVVWLYSLFPGFPGLRETTGRFDLRQLLKSLVKVWLAMLAPIIIVGGILTGIFTATEAGVVAVFYALIVSTCVYRDVAWRDIPQILSGAAIVTAMVVGIVAMAGALSWLLAYLEFNQAATSLFKGLSESPLIVMLMLMGATLVLTMFIESLAVMIMLAPLCVQLTQTYGLDPIHMGLLMVIATQIGGTTPPVAVLLFVATSIAQCRYDETIRYVFPFIAAEVAVLALVLFFPSLVTSIPRMVMG
jgi:tripartite ATP-independent transporter DctM subunit